MDGGTLSTSAEAHWRIACQNPRVRYRRLAPIALIALFGAACSGSDPSAPSATPPPSHSPRTTVAVHSTSTAPTTQSSASSPSVATTGPNVRPGEKPPKLPAIAKKHSSVGAEEFARYWFHALDWAYATTDSTLARTLFSPSCAGCRRFVEEILDAPRTHHEHFIGGRISVESTRLVGADRSSKRIVDVVVDQTRLKVVNSAGRVVQVTPPTSHALFRTWLSWRSGSWEVSEWKQAK